LYISSHQNVDVFSKEICANKVAGVK